MKNAKLLRSSLLAGATLILASCAGDPFQTKTPLDVDKEIKERPIVSTPTTKPVTVLKTSGHDLFSLSYDRGESLPGDMIGPLNIINLPVNDVLSIITSEFGIAVAPSPDTVNKTVTLMVPNQKPLATVLNLIAEQTGMFYTFENGVLKLETERSFQVRLPHVNAGSNFPQLQVNSNRSVSTDDDSGNTDQAFQDTSLKTFKSSLGEYERSINGLGAKGVQHDRASGLITFTADYKTYKRVGTYLQHVQKDRTVIVYEGWIFEVSFDDGRNVGLNIGNIAGKIGDVALGAVGGPVPLVAEAATTAGFVVTGTTDKFSFEAAIEFMDSVGETQVVAQPTISSINGGNALFQSIDIQEYLKIVKTGNSNNNNDNDNNNDDNNNDREGLSAELTTEAVNSGIQLSISGSLQNDLIQTHIQLLSTDVLEFVEFSAGLYGNLALPKTSMRHVNTMVNARPGDLIVFGGLIKEKANRVNRNLAGTDLTYKTDQLKQKSEIIVMLRPRIVKYDFDPELLKEKHSFNELKIGENALDQKSSSKDLAKQSSEITPVENGDENIIIIPDDKKGSQISSEKISDSEKKTPNIKNKNLPGEILIKTPSSKDVASNK